MIDIIVLLIIIRVFLQVMKKKAESGENGQGASAVPNRPREKKRFSQGGHLKQKEKSERAEHTAAPAKKKTPDILKKVNSHIYGTDADADDLEKYKRFLEEERRTDIREIAREMRCTMYQVIREIQDFKDMGYFRDVEIDDDNYVIRYMDSEERRNGGTEDPADAYWNTDYSGSFGGAGGGKSGSDGRQSYGAESGGRNPGSGNPGGGNPSGKNPSGRNPGSGNPSGRNPGSGNSNGKNPGSRHPDGGNPGRDGKERRTEAERGEAAEKAAAGMGSFRGGMDGGLPVPESLGGNSYMTMPEEGMKIGYITITEDFEPGYMTMPAGGMKIAYNTMPDAEKE